MHKIGLSPIYVSTINIYFHFLTELGHTYYCTGQMLGNSADQITYHKFKKFRIVYMMLCGISDNSQCSPEQHASKIIECVAHFDWTYCLCGKIPFQDTYFLIYVSRPKHTSYCVQYISDFPDHVHLWNIWNNKHIECIFFVILKQIRPLFPIVCPS